jgi:hypothetical protein
VLFKLAKSNFIRGLSIRTNLKSPILRKAAVKPGFNKDFTFKNYIQKEDLTSSIRILNNRYLFSISRL